MRGLTQLYAGELDESLKELQFALDVAQQEGLGTVNAEGLSILDRDREIFLQVKIKTATRKLMEAIDQYTVVRCHDL